METEFKVLEAYGFKQKARGLIGRKSGYLGKNEVLLLNGCRSIHTFFMRENLDVVFVDKQGKVQKSITGLRPFRFASCLCAKYVCERFSNEQPWFNSGDIVALKLTKVIK